MESLPLNPTPDQVPQLWNIYRFFLIFSGSYFVVDGVQFVFVRNDKSFKFRVVMVIHHIIVSSIEFLLYYLHPFMCYLFAWELLMEIATIFICLRYFGKQFDNKYVYGIGGVGALLLYPGARCPIAIYIVYLGWNGIVPFCDRYFWTLGLITSIFVFVLSVYYSIAVIWKNPRKMCFLKEKST